MGFQETGGVEVEWGMDLGGGGIGEKAGVGIGDTEMGVREWERRGDVGGNGGRRWDRGTRGERGEAG